MDSGSLGQHGVGWRARLEPACNSQQARVVGTHTFQAVMALRLATLASSGLKSSGILNKLPPGSLKGCRKKGRTPQHGTA